MTASISSGTACRLVKFLGMLGSEYPGERASAALKVDQLVRGHGLSWSDLIAPSESCSSTRDTSPESMIAFVLAHRHRLTPWEVSFIDGVCGQRKPVSEKQIGILLGIVETLRRAAA